MLSAVFLTGALLSACSPPLDDGRPSRWWTDTAAAICNPAAAACLSGESILKDRCARCHVIEPQGVSPYPGAQPFRNLKERWSRPALREALKAGITAEHDQSGIKLPLMALSEPEIEAVFAYLDALNRRAAPGGPGQ